MGVTAKPKIPRQKRKPHSKRKNLTVKPNTFTAKAKFSLQNQMSHGKQKTSRKTKNLTTKPKTSRQNQTVLQQK